MFARRKVVRTNAAQDTALREKLAATGKSDADVDAMEKDTHLLDAAREEGAIIVSLDDTARDLYMEASAIVGEIREVEWVNPETDEALGAWLAAGASREEPRTLGFRRA
jgi:hypothetical protein